MPTLHVTNLTKRFGNVEALRGVSFAVEAGEVFGYLGPNGAGKTTTLRIMLGLVRPSAGTVQILGQDVRYPDTRMSVGYLPGEVNLDRTMTAQQVLDYYAGYRRGRPPILRSTLLDALDVPPSVLDRKIKFLSHGTRQKIGIVVAMQHDPELMLLDEPTTGLDPLVQQSFREVVLDSARRGRTVLFSSHVLSEVEAICHRVAILREGKLVALESIDGLRSSMIRRLEVRFHTSVPPDLTSLPGIVRAELKPGEALLWLRGDINPILRRLAREDIEHIVFPEPALEDIFLGYYQESPRA